MRTYTLELIACNADETISTMLTNVETGEYREEVWEYKDNEWIWVNGWGTNGWDFGLYEVLNRVDSATDGMLENLLELGVIEFEI